MTALQLAGEELQTDDAGATAPPTCRACIPVSPAACPSLKSAPTVCSASHADQVDMLATVFRPGLAARAVQAASNVFVGWEEFVLLDHALAMLLVVQLRDVRVEPLPESLSPLLTAG